jgi:hypothetical protein
LIVAKIHLKDAIGPRPEIGAPARAVRNDTALASGSAQATPMPEDASVIDTTIAGVYSSIHLL